MELLHPLLAARWSPTVFDPASEVTAAETASILEAARWAPSAGNSEFSLYDLGQAVAHMTIQAQSLGLHARQFRAFDRAGLAADFDVPPHWQVSTMSAVGRVPAGVEASVRPDDPSAGRLRRPSTQLRWPRGCRSRSIVHQGRPECRRYPAGALKLRPTRPRAGIARRDGQRVGAAHRGR